MNRLNVSFNSGILLLALLAFLALAPALSYAKLSYHGIESTINDDTSIYTNVSLDFSQPVSQLEYRTNFPVSSLKTGGDFGPVVCNYKNTESGGLITCSLSGITKEKNTLYLNFESKGAINYSYGRYHFAASYELSEETDKFFVLVKLPESANLPEFPANESYSPSYGDTMTDGRRIMVIWDGSNVAAGQSLEFSVDYNLPPIRGNVTRYILIAAGIIILAVIAGAFFYTRRASKVNKNMVIASILNADEKRVIDITAAGGGSVLQKHIVRESGFSKAKVSRLVNSLVNRGVIKIEPVSGRENRILLAEKKEENNKDTASSSPIEEKTDALPKEGRIHE